MSLIEYFKKYFDSIISGLSESLHITYYSGVKYKKKNILLIAGYRHSGQCARNYGNTGGGYLDDGIIYA